MAPIWLCLLTFVPALAFQYGYEDPSRNLINNWDCEQDLGSDNFIASRSTADLITENCHTGAKCMRITQRRHRDGNFIYRIPKSDGVLETGASYYLSSFIYLLNNASDTDGYSTVDLNTRFIYEDGTFRKYYVGRLPYQVADGRWKQLGGDFKVPTKPWTRMDIYMSMHEVDVNFVVDTFSLVRLERDDNWKTTLQSRIDQVRKGPFSYRVQSTKGSEDPTGSNSIKGSLFEQPTPGTIKIEHVKHDFGFGTAVKAAKMVRTSPTNMAYKQFIHDNFNCAVFENALKWKSMEKAKGWIVTSQTDAAIQMLRDWGFPVRGHAILWDVMETNPAWVLDVADTATEEEVWRRVNYVVDHYKGQIWEWDVCNEVLHKRYFEDTTGNKDLLYQEFQRAHQIDPAAGLCLNDYQLTRTGQFTSAQADLAMDLLERNLPVTCIGVQSHLRDVNVPIEALERRVEVLAQVRLPLTITEFSVHTYDEAEKARALEEAFYVYFANPAVQAIMIWGFAPGYAFSPDMYLTDASFTPNPAGSKMLELIHERWHTREEFPLSEFPSHTFQAYHGLYNVTVLQGGQAVHNQQVYLHPGGQVDLDIVLQ